MTYLTIFNAANATDFQGRCQVAVWIAARDIRAEAPDAPDHLSRMDFARRVLRDAVTVTPRQLAMLALADPIVAAAPDAATDEQIQAQINKALPAIIAMG